MTTGRTASVAAGLFLLLTTAGCGGASPPAAPRPSILLVTLDTTRADAIGPDAKGIDTPAFNALAARGARFRHAYATAPETMPSHSSLLSGLYPGGHGVHENGRRLRAGVPLVTEDLQRAGYETAAFVSSFVLARQYGLARGFATYDDDLAGGVERSARATTDRVVAFLERAPARPLFLWVHYFDPHAPYAPPEPYRSRFAQRPYLGEVAAMDEELGRLIQTFERRARDGAALIVVGDHGEGLGDHGERQHGHLLYQSAMHVPLAIAGPGVSAGVRDEPVSTRHVFHTIRDWAGADAAGSLRTPAASPAVVLGEAMKPFLNYGWQPQVMAIEGTRKAIQAGRIELYDVGADPAEAKDLAAAAPVPRSLVDALRDYPIPSLDAGRPARGMSDEDRRKLSSLGYVSAGAAPVVRKDAPRPADMTRLFETMEQASDRFVTARYKEAVPLLTRILAADPQNLDAALRLASSYSALGQNDAAMAAFRKAASMAPRSPDVRMYVALHLARGAQWSQAVPMLEQVLVEDPDRLPALSGLALLRVKQNRPADALALWQQVQAQRALTPAELVEVGTLAMSLQRTDVAIEAFEDARARQGGGFRHDLELGVLYLAARKYPESRDALDRRLAVQPNDPMALFKRAQVSVLLKEPDSARRIQLARDKADATTRALIGAEKLFKK
jgi:arylsulfatase A-like enzyme/Tfp pilus assembly protein PilF